MKNEIKIELLLESIYVIEYIKYNDGTFENLYYIKKLKKGIKKLQRDLEHFSDYKSINSLRSEDSKNYIIGLHKKLNEYIITFDKLKNGILNKSNDIKFMSYKYFDNTYFIKLKNCKFHNNCGPAIITKNSNKNYNRFFIDGKELNEKEWLKYNRKEKIKNLKGL